MTFHEPLDSDAAPSLEERFCAHVRTGESEAACRLLEEVELAGRRFRLTGVAVGQLSDGSEPQQLDLLAMAETEAEPEARGARLQGVLSEVRRKFGHQALYPADAGQSERAGSAGGFTKSSPDEES